MPQMEMAECGAVSLAMVMAYHGVRVSPAEVREICGVSRDGVSALALVRGAETFGFVAEGVRLDMPDLDALPLPAILHWGFGHFVVLEAVNSKRLLIVDPAAGRLRVAVEDASRQFTGVAILVAPGPGSSARQQVSARSERLLLAVCRSFRPFIVQVLACTALLQILSLALPVCLRAVVDGKAIRSAKLLAAFGICAAVMLLLRAARNRVLRGIQLRMDEALLSGLLAHLFRLPIGFFLQRRPGDLVNRLYGSALVRDLFSSITVALVLDGVLCIGYFAVLAMYDLSSCLVAGLAGLLMVLIFVGRQERENAALGSELAAEGREASAVAEILGSLETVRAAGGEARALRRWRDVAVDRLNQSLPRRRFMISDGLTARSLQGATTCIIALLSARRVLVGALTIGEFSAVLFLQIAIMVPLRSVLRALGDLRYLRSYFARLDDISMCDAEPIRLQSPAAIVGAVKVRNVSYRYSRTSPYQVRDVTFEIRAGDDVAIVGPSGAGKSTLGRLLVGLLQPTCGEILLDDRRLVDFGMTELAGQVGVVLQEPFLFNGTIWQNLTMLDGSIQRRELDRAVEAACAKGFLSQMPDGYETLIGDGGSKLSGGERQRLCLARALVRQPKILLLDEATSAVDPATEASIYENLKALNTTRIVISHRDSVVRRASHVMVMAHGEVIEQGPYLALSVNSRVAAGLLLAGREHRAPA